LENELHQKVAVNMNSVKLCAGIATAGLIALQCCFGITLGSEPVSKTSQIPHCKDSIAAQATIDASLDSPFFRSKEASYPFYIVAHDDGTLENTLGGAIKDKEAVKIEHTARCVSSHMGGHLMSFCTAEMDDGGVKLAISGGLPAFASYLTVGIHKDRMLTCSFEAAYPSPTGKLEWRVTRKILRLKDDKFQRGTRLFGWLSVEFDEIETLNGNVIRSSHKIEGYVKPVIQKPAQNPSFR
jgi:hypothetical protein